ncbi:Hypothetical predicted protein [Xyrichtys novacula]|uniref:Uncharacterized protein n=1 Tax=Xyrichtys novacula TaxID=13765 RepID=A0AAV1EUX3_XYRNO|nr:Hypothetical predicted protein [Xyrichtys novacula]
MQDHRDCEFNLRCLNAKYQDLRAARLEDILRYTETIDSLQKQLKEKEETWTKDLHKKQKQNEIAKNNTKQLELEKLELGRQVLTWKNEKTRIQKLYDQQEALSKRILKQKLEKQKLEMEDEFKEERKKHEAIVKKNVQDLMDNEKMIKSLQEKLQTSEKKVEKLERLLENQVTEDMKRIVAHNKEVGELKEKYAILDKKYTDAEEELIKLNEVALEAKLLKEQRDFFKCKASQESKKLDEAKNTIEKQGEEIKNHKEATGILKTANYNLYQKQFHGGMETMLLRDADRKLKGENKELLEMTREKGFQIKRLEREKRELTQKNTALDLANKAKESEVDKLKNTVQSLQTFVERFKYDINACKPDLQNPKNLKDRVINMHKKYIGAENKPQVDIQINAENNPARGFRPFWGKNNKVSPV